MYVAKIAIRPWTCCEHKQNLSNGGKRTHDCFIRECKLRENTAEHFLLKNNGVGNQLNVDNCVSASMNSSDSDVHDQGPREEDGRCAQERKIPSLSGRGALREHLDTIQTARNQSEEEHGE